MSKNCLEGYLTEGCKTCPVWQNSEDSIGCGFRYDIMLCPHFAKMFNEAENKRALKEE